ncbi:MAG TPA: CCA tRNA nucleotidyltransferase [Caproiciproducens sp.]|nr:CCA tRNA nucleotidyltransferase [Caproiciproducens sp.]
MGTKIKIQIPVQAERILEILKENRYEAYLVGGCVRDSLLSLKPYDWDIATSAQPEEIKTALKDFKQIDTGLKHGTVTIVSDHMPVEVTTFRVDGTYSDNRHPDQVLFTGSLQEDLGRRDFTVNALAYSPETGIVDCFGGIQDLQKQVIRCVGEPDKRFQEDGLRILRALRFSAVLGFQIEDSTSESIFRNAPLLDGIACERIRTEFTKLLCGKNAVPILRKYRLVLNRFVPELNETVQFRQNNPYHIYDVWEHTLKALDSIEPLPVLRYTMLLHDIGKPCCYTQDANGIGHFHGHGEKSAELANTILHRLRFDNAFIHQVVTLVKYHDTALHPDKKYLLERLRLLGEENIRLLYQIKEADIRAQNPDYLGRLDSLQESKKLFKEILAQKLCYSLKDLAVNGKDLIGINITQGIKIGETLSRLLDEVIDGTCVNQRDLLLKRAQALTSASGDADSKN